MKKVLVTGSEGFIGGYIVKELLNQNYQVYGIDNLTKYGQIIRNHSDDENYKFFNEDIKNKDFLKEIMSECDYLIAGAAMIGGISYFHELSQRNFLLNMEFPTSYYLYLGKNPKNNSNDLSLYILQ